MDWKVSTGPGSEPVTLEEAKLHLRVDADDDDNLITELIKASRRWCEQYQGRAFINQSITLKLDKFVNKIKLPMAPLVSVTSIKYLDTAGVQQTLDNSVYDVDTISEPGQINLAYNQSWPTTRLVHHAVEIIFVAGYGATASAVPEDIKSAIKLLLGHFYENREHSSTLTLKTIPISAKSLLAIDKVF